MAARSTLVWGRLQHSCLIFFAFRVGGSNSSDVPLSDYVDLTALSERNADTALAEPNVDSIGTAAITAIPIQHPPAASWPVTLDLPPESVTMKSWDALKGSMDHLGEQVQQVLLVKTDMSSLQADLRTQQQLWEQAEQQLKNENAQLARQIEALQLQVHEGRSSKEDLADMQKQVEEAQRNHSDLKHVFDDDEKTHMLEVAFWDTRIRNVQSQLIEANRTAEAEVAKAHDAQLHVQADYQALRLKGAELQDRLRDGQKGLPLQQEQADAKTRDLGRQLAEMQVGLAHMTQQLIPEGTIEKEIASLKKRLDAETIKVVQLTEEQAQDANNCEVEKRKHASVLLSEQAKHDSQATEVKQLCHAVNARRTVLDSMIKKCEAGDLPAHMPPPSMAMS